MFGIGAPCNTFINIFLINFLFQSFTVSFIFRDEFFAGGFAPKRSTGPKVDSKMSDKRGRSQKKNSEKNYKKNRKAYIIDNVDFLNKFH